ncbi:hypothetical protein HPB50_013245 [Hyalomma asiaticum]|uniref:Uncharacterized protein n=1 Tax=Hyalomma asiaticum TaxID=266040 RepID=A0ACB7RKY5_HYAAI|nr:hypothetical protein HPB50_013245 [Hyalomma asiaticum]
MPPNNFSALRLRADDVISPRNRALSGGGTSPDLDPIKQLPQRSIFSGSGSSPAVMSPKFAWLVLQDIKVADTLPYGYLSGGWVELLIGAAYYWDLCLSPVRSLFLCLRLRRLEFSRHYWDIVTGNVKCLNGQLVAMEMMFGWTLRSKDVTSSAATYVTCVRVMRVGAIVDRAGEVSHQLRSLWELEHLGIVDDAQLTAEDNNFLRAFEDTTVRKNGHY